MSENPPAPPAPLSPSAAIAAAAGNVTTVTDANGRKITFRSLGILDQARIYKAIGPLQAENGPYTRLATLAVSVVAYDDVPAPPMPLNDRDVEAAIARLGDDGFVAISLELNRRVEAKEIAARSPETVAAEAKN